jgi:hypothetical protein
MAAPFEALSSNDSPSGGAKGGGRNDSLFSKLQEALSKTERRRD